LFNSPRERVPNRQKSKCACRPFPQEERRHIECHPDSQASREILKKFEDPLSSHRIESGSMDLSIPPEAQPDEIPGRADTRQGASAACAPLKNRDATLIRVPGAAGSHDQFSVPRAACRQSEVPWFELHFQRRDSESKKSKIRSRRSGVGIPDARPGRDDHLV
jgi:hypothetical protein